MGAARLAGRGHRGRKAWEVNPLCPEDGEPSSYPGTPCSPHALRPRQVRGLLDAFILTTESLFVPTPVCFPLPTCPLHSCLLHICLLYAAQPSSSRAFCTIGHLSVPRHLYPSIIPAYLYLLISCHLSINQSYHLSMCLAPTDCLLLAQVQVHPQCGWQTR